METQLHNPHESTEADKNISRHEFTRSEFSSCIFHKKNCRRCCIQLFTFIYSFLLHWDPHSFVHFVHLSHSFLFSQFFFFFLFLLAFFLKKKCNRLNFMVMIHICRKKLNIIVRNPYPSFVNTYYLETLVIRSLINIFN